VRPRLGAAACGTVGLQQWGFDAVIAPSFGDIFRLNCYSNGLLPVVCRPRVGGQAAGRCRRMTPIPSRYLGVAQKTVIVPN